ncbi:hypothetical protein H2199_005839 [Coniosporium tulheliwenetii]|uniref:Uncharacterized protein n=1 Tax=Coniosporium tulheliwenetii TaxID=3383036 RepID=A0ACC2YYG1_9PEZI|nr:hypothetical protein H2199_005839 [Cladosporium sp. JES 115]
MAPRQREPSIDRTEETVLDREPKVGPRHLDLFRLYKRADRDASAYEITNIHKREPPPKEILEDVTAKGGDLLNRTLENFLIPGGRDAESSANDVDKDKEGEGSDREPVKTPKEEKMDIDEPGSTGGRVTRGSGSVGAQTNGTHATSFSLANYEPSQPIASSVKPVVTPGNNPDYFRNMARKLAASRASRGVQHHKGMMLPGTGFIGPNIYIRALLALQSGIAEEQKYALHHLVKISHERGDKYRFDGFPGLAEALIAKVLEVSSLFYDVRWEISYADTESTADPYTLNGLTGTPDLLQKISALTPLDVGDDIQTEEFSEALATINEAGLILRNMVMLDQNAEYVASLPLVKDFIVIALNLPHVPCVVELQHYALEIAEQLTKFYVLGGQSPLYQSLLAQLESADRGAIITSLRALGRIAMNSEVNNRLSDVPVPILQRICDWLLVEDEELRLACLDFLYQFTAILDNVEILARNVNSQSLVNQLVRLLLYHAHFDERRERTRTLAKNGPPPDTPPRLASTIVEQLAVIEEPERSSQWLKTCFEEDPSGEITQIALWTAYNQSFQAASQQPGRPALSQAKDFITNVSNTFPGAIAQVVQQGPIAKYTIKGLRPRSVPVDLRGRPYMPCQWLIPAPPSVTLPAQLPNQPPRPKLQPCNEYAFKPQQMWEHVLSSHLGLPYDAATGKFDLEIVRSTSDPMLDVKPDIKPLPERRYDCKWGGCRHFAATNGESNPHVVAKHIKTHLPDDSPQSAHRMRHNRVPPPDSETDSPLASNPTSAKAQKYFLNTATDERNDAAGLPLASVLVLRNLARGFGKMDAASGGDENWVRSVFAPVKEQLYFVMAYNLSLREYIASLTRAVAAAGVGSNGVEDDSSVVAGYNPRSTLRR